MTTSTSGAPEHWSCGCVQRREDLPRSSGFDTSLDDGESSGPFGVCLNDLDALLCVTGDMLDISRASGDAVGNAVCSHCSHLEAEEASGI